jgi:hypothetical protein
VHLFLGNSVTLGSVDNGWLTVNFAARQFATGLTMSQQQVGSVSLQAAGTVRDNGMFSVNTTTGGRVAGALTLDGKEAGYFFEQAVKGGMFMGITRWSR